MPADPANSICEINVENVNYSIGTQSILKNISFRSTDRRIGVVGRNGSGKSTLARLLCGLLSADSGSIRIDGCDVATDRNLALKTVGMLFQNPDQQIIFPTVVEEVGFGLRQMGLSKTEAKDTALQSLESFGCLKWASRSVSTLSQGQRHLVCLISIVAMQPRVIVLDEPYAGLDVPTVMQLSAFLAKVDSVIVHISHQVDVLKDYERVLWLDEGEICMDGKADITLNTYLEKMTKLGESGVIV